MKSLKDHFRKPQVKIPAQMQRDAQRSLVGRMKTRTIREMLDTVKPPNRLLNDREAVENRLRRQGRQFSGTPQGMTKLWRPQTITFGANPQLLVDGDRVVLAGNVGYSRPTSYEIIDAKLAEHCQSLID